ncbi:MAG: N-acetyltransferase [Planctomycetota bacterium]|nr:N-acetyltransferase [Planctomycetota bacterium]
MPNLTTAEVPSSGVPLPELQVQPVTTRGQRKQFLEFPWSLYRDDPHWIPPLRMNQKELVGYKKHPFYEENEAQTFLATRNGTVCGRIAAILDHGHNRYHKEQRGFFGFFESVDDSEVATGLFTAVREWFAARDIDQLRGPVNPSLNYECGLLVDAFDAPPTFMMTYNKPYYERLIEHVGFRKSQDLFSFWGHLEMLAGLDDKLAFIGDEAKKRFNVQVRSLDKSRFREEVDTYLKIYNASLSSNWGFVPLSDSEARHFSAALRWLIEPELTCIAEVDGKVVGACFALLDYNPRIREMDGRLLPLGFLKLLRKRHDIKRIRAIATTVVPEYQKWGLSLVVLRGLLPKALDYGIEECEFSWVAESNRLSRRSLEKGGAKLTKTHRLYDYPPPAGTGE